MRTRIIEGREFDQNDRQLNECILNQSAAEFFFPHEPVLGRYVRNRVNDQFTQKVECQVIGIAEDAKFYDLRQGPPRTIYLPLSTSIRREFHSFPSKVAENPAFVSRMFAAVDDFSEK
jgi:MacB-like periplasmic core domain